MNPGDFTNTNFDPASLDKTIAQIREMTEKLIESNRTAGRAALDAYEKALRSMVDFQERVARGGNQLDWISALASAHTKFVEDISAAYVKAARDSVK
ncbi:hypothetical protein [Mycobacterium sp. 155]|uniref:hypothetical protein n=1 Tax=Mycobacterium sp. 155 TaxID=1157943 RepID=UPI00037C60BA|nr:hypothetical protein [Mycobacterium sp. 155]